MMLLEAGHDIDAIFLDLDYLEIHDVDSEAVLNELLKGHSAPPLILSAPLMNKPNKKEMLGTSRFVSKPPKQEEFFKALSYSFTGKEHIAQRFLAPKAEDKPVLGELFDIQILLAEDNKVNQKVAVNMFKRLGFGIDIAENGADAIAMLEQSAYDVIFMDVQMPEMDGVEATKIINEKWGESRPLIIAMTANAMTGDREKFLAAGMDDYVSKPVRVSDIEEAIMRSEDRFKKKTI